jgi:signal transduction histidine kinase
MLSVRAQLTALFVVPLVIATGMVAFVAQRISRNAVEQYASSILQSDAQGKRDSIMALVRRQRTAAANLLEIAEANCSISGKLNLVCTREALEQFAAREHTNCAVLSSGHVAITARHCQVQPLQADEDELPFVLGLSSYRITQANHDFGVSIVADYSLNEVYRILAGGDFAASTSALVLTTTGQMVAPPSKRQISAAMSCSTTHAEDGEGHKFMVRSVGLPLLGACVLSEMPEQQALAPSAMLRRASWLMIAAFIGAALLLSYGAATLITVPLARLTRRATLLRYGDLETPIPMSGPTEVQKLGLALSEAAASLKSARQTELDRERAEGESGMAANLAHQINNPLTSVISALSLLENRVETEHDHKLLKFANEDARRIATITRHLVTLYRGSNTAGLLDLSELLKEIIEEHRPELQKRGGVTVRLELSPATVAGFRTELKQALDNVFQNAVAAAAPASEIVVRCSRSRESQEPFRYGARIVVHNRGAAVEPSLRDKVLHPFTSSSTIRGKGLGLWAANAAVHKHRGRLRFRSGSGITTVSIFLPHVTTVAA